MNYKTFLPATVMLLGVLIARCGASLYTPKPEDATLDASFDELNTGRALYAQRCSSCHALYSPADFKESHWRKTIPEMQQRAKLSNSEKLLVEKYLITGTKLARAH